MINGPFDLLEFLYIFLAINSFPDPVGPLIKTLLSDCDNFWIWSFIEIIFELFPIISNEWNNLFDKDLFSFFKFKFSTALFTKFNNLLYQKVFG